MHRGRIFGGLPTFRLQIACRRRGGSYAGDEHKQLSMTASFTPRVCNRAQDETNSHSNTQRRVGMQANGAIRRFRASDRMSFKPFATQLDPLRGAAQLFLRLFPQIYAADLYEVLDVFRQDREI